MCPACIASAAWIAGSVISTGGIAALTLRIARSKKTAPTDNSKSETERTKEHDDE